MQVIRYLPSGDVAGQRVAPETTARRRHMPCIRAPPAVLI